MDLDKTAPFASFDLCSTNDCFKLIKLMSATPPLPDKLFWNTREASSDMEKTVHLKDYFVECLFSMIRCRKLSENIIIIQFACKILVLR